MRTKNLLVSVGIIVALLFLFAVPRSFNYQGKLVDSSGVGINDTLALTFRLYTSETGGSALWEETIPNVVVHQGLFSVELTDFPDSVDFSQQYWLEVVIEGEPLTPREKLVSAPYSLHAGIAERGYNPVYSEANSTTRRGDFVFRAGRGATLEDDGGTINIVLSSPFIPNLNQVLVAGRDAGGQRIENLADPVNAQDVATKAYVDSRTENPDWLAMIHRERGAGAGLSFAGDSFSVNVDNSTLEIFADILRVKEEGIGTRELASTGVTPGSYTTANITVDEDGRILAASNGSAGVGGSGTTGYIPKWTGTSELGSSIIYDNGTNVGIGTTSPTAKLEVNGNLKVNGNFYAPGTVAQVVVRTSDVRSSLNTTTFTEANTDYRISITPKFNNSKIIVEYYFSINAAMASNTIFHFQLIRNIGDASEVPIGVGPAYGSSRQRTTYVDRPSNGYDSNDMQTVYLMGVDTGLTAGTTYTYGFKYRRETGGSGTCYFNYSANDWQAGFSGIMTMKVTEITQ